MAKVLLLEIPDTVAYNFGDFATGNDIRQIPDLGLAPGVVWTSSLTDHGVVRIHIERTNPDRVGDLMFLDFGLLQGVQHWVVEADKREIAMLKNRLGDASVTIFIHALRNRAPVRARADSLGWKRKRRKSNNDVISMRIPLVTCGGGDGSDLDLDDEAGETEDNIPALADL